MKDHGVFWDLGVLSDRELLERMGSMLGSSRRLMAELIAHLGEVEERRLHLAACSSMFTYCLKLGMTEDEAYRRIEVARLARRYPAIFPSLANGQLSISVVALLKHHLSVENHLELLAAVKGKSVAQTRELIATLFPRPDVTSSLRKLPERRTMIQPSLAMSDAVKSCAAVEVSVSVPEPRTVMPEPRTAETEPRTGEPRPVQSVRVTPPRVASRIEPLSTQRYKVQFTASAELARKLELARDLMRHAHPGGELGPIVERALDVLIESLMQRRFGKKASPKRRTERAGLTDPEDRLDVMATHETAEPDTPTHGMASSSAAEPHAVASTTEPATAPKLDTAEPTVPMSATSNVGVGRRADGGRASGASCIPRSSRRTVVERDGLSCSWVDEEGARCGSRAWLEYDHRHPRAKGGGSEPDNVRLLCRCHNRLAAEREYGRGHVERAITERKRERAAHSPPTSPT